MARLRKRKTKTGFHYVVDFRHQGKRRVLSLKTSDRKLAEKVKRELEAKIVLGKFDVNDHQDQTILVSTYFKRYFEAIEGTKAETTIAIEKIYSKTFQGIAGDIALDQVTTTVAERWQHERLKSVKPVTVNDERRVLSHIFNRAVDEGLIAANPFRKLKRLKEQQKRLYMTSEELTLFFQELELRSKNARNAPHRRAYYKFKLFCEVLLNTGMRRSELVKLKGEDIDLQGNVIRVEEAKGKKRREIPMTGRVREIVSELGPTLFNDLTKNQVTHKFIAVARRLHLEGAKLHSLRHTFGTYLIAMGYDITVVKELLGHEDIKTTLIYAKADKRLLEKAVESFGELAKSGYKMVTKLSGENEKPLIGNE